MNHCVRIDEHTTLVAQTNSNSLANATIGRLTNFHPHRSIGHSHSHAHAFQIEVDEFPLQLARYWLLALTLQRQSQSNQISIGRTSLALEVH